MVIGASRRNTMFRKREFMLTLATVLAVGTATARAADETGFINRVLKSADGGEARYVVFVPHDFEKGKQYPVILFLHGAGEWGHDGKKQVTVGLGTAVRKREKTFPFVVVFPQSQKKTWPVNPRDPKDFHDVIVTWSEQEPEGKRALGMLEDVMKEYGGDPERVYLTGLSMGGFGTWSLAASRPDRWAAIAPVCGGGNPQDADKIKHLPCWCFHGGTDEVVPVNRSREMMGALWAAGGHPNYTEYPGVGHNSWDKAYDTDDLYQWFLKHRLKKNP
jgi:predicted peptidase